MFLMHELAGFRAADVDVARRIPPPVHILPLRQEHVLVPGCFAFSNDDSPEAGLRCGVGWYLVDLLDQNVALAIVFMFLVFHVGCFLLSGLHFFHRLVLWRLIRETVRGLNSS